jgi:hypothetical protein
MGYFDGRDGGLPIEERPSNSSRAISSTTSAEQLISGDNARSRQPSRSAHRRAVQTCSIASGRKLRGHSWMIRGMRLLGLTPNDGLRTAAAPEGVVRGGYLYAIFFSSSRMSETSW